VSMICDASPCTIGGLSNGQEYRFTVSARNAAGWSSAGGPADPVVPDTAPEQVPVGSVTPGDRSLTITWSPPVNNGSPVDSYNVQLISLTGGSGGGTFPVSSGLSTTVGGLVNNDEYEVRIQAHNGAGWGPYGSSRTVQSVGTPPPVATPGLQYPRPTPNDSSVPVQVSWPDTDANGPPLVSYTVWRQVNGGDWTVLATVSAGAANVATDIEAILPRFVGGFNRGDTRAKEVTRILLDLADPLPPAATLATGLGWLRDVDLRPLAPRVMAPTLLVHGANDPLMPLAAAEALATLIPGARLATFADCAHTPFISRPEEFLERVQAFLNE